MHNFFSTFNILFDTTGIRIMLLFNLLLQIYWISTRFSLFASFSVSYFMMLGFKKTFFFEFLFNSPFGKCWLIPALNAGRPRRRFCPTFCHSFWLLSNLIRNYRWSLILNISQMSNPNFLIYFKFLYFYDSFIVCFVYK